MFQVTLEVYGDVVAIQIPSSKRQDFVRSLKEVKPNGLLALTSAAGERVVFMKSADFQVDASNLKELLIELPPKEWQCLEEAVQEHLEEEPGFPLDHSFEPYGAKFIPDAIVDVVIETVDG